MVCNLLIDLQYGILQSTFVETETFLLLFWFIKFQLYSYIVRIHSHKNNDLTIR